MGAGIYDTNPWFANVSTRLNGGLQFYNTLMTMFGDPSAQGNIVAGIVTGIGFIGGGAILKDKSSVSGNSTAAAIWATGAVGIAVGLGRLEIVIALSIMTYITLKLVGKVKEKVDS